MLAKICFNDEMYEMKFGEKIRDGNYINMENAIKEFLEKMKAEVKEIPYMTVYQDEEGNLSNYQLKKGSFDNSKKRMFQSHLSEELKEKIKEDFPEVEYELNGEMHKEKIGVNLYHEGFVINMGKQAANFFGMISTQYFNKITKGSISNYLKTIVRSSARRFKTIKQFINYLEKDEYYLHRFVVKGGYYLTWEFASDAYAEKFDMEKNKKYISKVEEILDRINEEDEELIEEFFEKEERVFGETPKEEAIIRMKEMGLWENIIEKFEKDEIPMISDKGGIFFDPDEKAKEVSNEAIRNGGLPYLVVKYGRIYSCLYVSKYKEEWDMERFNKRIGIIKTITTTDFPDHYDYGDIVVNVTSAGGLSRIG